MMSFNELFNDIDRNQLVGGDLLNDWDVLLDGRVCVTVLTDTGDRGKKRGKRLKRMENN